MTSLINIAFGASSAYLWFCLLWGGNGLLQVGIPPWSVSPSSHSLSSGFLRMEWWQADSCVYSAKFFKRYTWSAGHHGH